MKTGVIYVRMVEVSCPGCGEFVGDKRTGSHLLSAESGYRAGEAYECFGCGETFRMPALKGVLEARS